MQETKHSLPGEHCFRCSKKVETFDWPLNKKYLLNYKKPVKLMQWVKIAHSFLQSMSNMFLLIILSLPM